MNDGRDPFDVLRERAKAPEPASEEIAVARARLQRAIAAEQNAYNRLGARWSWRPGARWNWRAVAAITVTAVLVGVAVPLFRTSPAQAALVEIALAARQATSLDVPRGSYIAATSERVDLAIRPGEEFGFNQEAVAYLLPTTRRVWRQPIEQFVLIQTTVGRPTFFDPSHERAYYAGGLDAADQIGKTTVEKFVEVTDPIIETDWPINSHDLLQAMEEFIGDSREVQSSPADIFLLAADLLRETNPPPALRAAVLEVLSDLPLDLEHHGQLSTTVSLIDSDRQLTMELSGVGALITETITLVNEDPELGIPAGTVLTEVHYQMPEVVDELPQQPEPPS